MVAALTTATQAAIYATATRFVTFGIVGVAALQQALSPLVSKLLAGGERDMAETVYQTATVWMMCLAWPIYLLSASFAGPLLRVFGAGYDAGHTVVTILALAMLFATACGPADSVLLMAGRSWLSLWNTTIALVLSIGLNLVLIPRGRNHRCRDHLGSGHHRPQCPPGAPAAPLRAAAPGEPDRASRRGGERRAVRGAPLGGESHEPPTRHRRPRRSA